MKQVSKNITKALQKQKLQKSVQAAEATTSRADFGEY
jgi:hypothetical protein